jgi:hypothetical protein
MNSPPVRSEVPGPMLCNPRFEAFLPDFPFATAPLPPMAWGSGGHRGRPPSHAPARAVSATEGSPVHGSVFWALSPQKKWTEKNTARQRSP